MPTWAWCEPSFCGRLASSFVARQDVVFLVYSVIQPDSLQAAKTTLLAELREFAPLVSSHPMHGVARCSLPWHKAPIILIGNKTDMRADQDVCERLKKRQMTPLTTQVGSLRGCRFICCSIFTALLPHKDGERAAQQIGALGFFEISCAQDRDPLERVFREGLLLVFGPPKQVSPSNSRLHSHSSAQKKTRGQARLSTATGNSNNQDGGSMRGKNCVLQ